MSIQTTTQNSDTPILKTWFLCHSNQFHLNFHYICTHLQTVTVTVHDDNPYFSDKLAYVCWTLQANCKRSPCRYDYIYQLFTWTQLLRSPLHSLCNPFEFFHYYHLKVLAFVWVSPQSQSQIDSISRCTAETAAPPTCWYLPTGARDLVRLKHRC